MKVNSQLNGKVELLIQNSHENSGQLKITHVEILEIKKEPWRFWKEKLIEDKLVNKTEGFLHNSMVLFVLFAERAMGITFIILEWICQVSLTLISYSWSLSEIAVTDLVFLLRSAQNEKNTLFGTT